MLEEYIPFILVKKSPCSPPINVQGAANDMKIESLLYNPVKLFVSPMKVMVPDKFRELVRRFILPLPEVDNCGIVTFQVPSKLWVLFPLPLLLFVTVSFPQPAMSPIIIKVVNNIISAVANLLLDSVGLIPAIFLMAYKDKMFKCCLIFLKGLITYVILGFIPGFFLTLLIPILYSSTDFGFKASLRFIGNISIITSVNFLNQLILSLWSSVTLSAIVFICFCLVLFFIINYYKRAPSLITSCMIPIGMLAKSFEAPFHSFCGSSVSYVSKIKYLFSFVNYNFSLMLKSA